MVTSRGIWVNNQSGGSCYCVPVLWAQSSVTRFKPARFFKLNCMFAALEEIQQHTGSCTGLHKRTALRVTFLFFMAGVLELYDHIFKKVIKDKQ